MGPEVEVKPPCGRQGGRREVATMADEQEPATTEPPSRGDTEQERALVDAFNEELARLEAAAAVGDSEAAWLLEQLRAKRKGKE